MGRKRHTAGVSILPLNILYCRRVGEGSLSAPVPERTTALAARGTPFGTRSQLARPDGNVRAEQGRSKRDRTTDAVADGDRLTRDSSCPR